MTSQLFDASPASRPSSPIDEDGFLSSPRLAKQGLHVNHTHYPSDDIASSAVTDVMNNQELVDVIFQALRASDLGGGSLIDSDQSPWKHRLLPLLLVNQSFFESARALLWQEMHSLIPAFSLLPSFKSHEGAITATHTLAGIQPEDWIRFRLYANHVQIFTFNHSDANVSFSDHWLVYLATRGAQTPLFPHLRTISQKYDATGAQCHLPLVMHQGVQSLTFHAAAPLKKPNVIPRNWSSTERPRDFVEGLFTGIADRASESELQALTYLGPTSPTLWRCVSHMQGITDLNITPTNKNHFEVLSPIANLTSLRRLKLVALHKWDTGALGSIVINEYTGGGAPLLPKLIELEIVGPTGNFQCFTAMFSALKTIERLEIQLTTFTPGFVSAFAATLNRNSGTLERVVLKDGPIFRFADSISSVPHQAALLKAIADTTCNKRLVEWDLGGIPIFQGKAIDICLGCLGLGLLNAFPTLTTLRFRMPWTRMKETDKPHFGTFSTLAQFVALSDCSTLQHLELQFRASSFQCDPGPLPLTGGHHGLKTLGIVTTAKTMTPAHRIKVAEFLDQLFPSLELFWGSATEDCEAVDTLIHSYQRKREAWILSTSMQRLTFSGSDTEEVYVERGVQTEYEAEEGARSTVAADEGPEANATYETSMRLSEADDTSA